MKLIFFIGTLRTGGKERRLVELLTYLKRNTDFEMLLILRQNQINYQSFYKLNIPFKLVTKEYKKGDIFLHLKLYKICKAFQPDIIHTWGNMPAFVSLLFVIFQGIPHINSQITSAPPRINKWSWYFLVDRLNFLFSDIILSNSFAGVKTFNPPAKKTKIVYNGINLERFKNLPSKARVKSKHQIVTKYAIIMLASFSNNKNYDLYIEVAKTVIQKRDDISFICAGGGVNLKRIRNTCINYPNIIFTGRINKVEELLNICDVGVLFSPNGEGISNAILEYMALSKPVIANDAGGTREIVKHGVNGFLISNGCSDDIADILIDLIDDVQKRKSMGIAGRKMIERQFTIDKMGRTIIKIYEDII